jgi:hypothetical protein
MKNLEKAKELYFHREYQKAIHLLEELKAIKTVEENPLEYSNILCYLGDSKLELYKEKINNGEIINKSLIHDAIKDFTEAETIFLNVVPIHPEGFKKRFKDCNELL